jgi:hypothetical protein
MRGLVGQECVDTIIHDQLALASDDAQAQLENDKVLHLAPIGKPMPTVSLAVEQGGSSINKTAACENQDMTTSEMPMHIEARAITDTTDLAIKPLFDSHGYVVW